MKKTKKQLNHTILPTLLILQIGSKKRPHRTGGGRGDPRSVREWIGQRRRSWCAATSHRRKMPRWTFLLKPVCDSRTAVEDVEEGGGIYNGRDGIALQAKLWRKGLDQGLEGCWCFGVGEKRVKKSNSTQKAYQMKPGNFGTNTHWRMAQVSRKTGWDGVRGNQTKNEFPETIGLVNNRAEDKNTRILWLQKGYIPWKGWKEIDGSMALQPRHQVVGYRRSAARPA